MSADYIYIDSSEQLADFCDAIKNAVYCAIDTEFVREKTYYPILSLVQIATDTHMACVDPLVIEDFDPLIRLIQNQNLVKVFHSPSQDLEILYQQFSTMPQPMFDTQLAAAVLGYDYQIGYADLVEQITGTKLEKKHTRANWNRRPLTQDEIDYAMDDVRYLLPVYRVLKSELEDKKRYAWIENDLIAMTSISNYQPDTDSLWKRLKGVQKLKGVELEIVRHLCRWREEKAQHKNLPRRWVVKDDLLIDVARLKPTEMTDLNSIRDINEKFIQHQGKALLKIVDSALKTPASEWPAHETKQLLSTHQQAIGDCLMGLCRVVAEDNRIALATLATRNDIDNLIINRKNSRLSQGWRFKMVGEKLLNFIYGQTSLTIRDNQIEFESAG